VPNNLRERVRAAKTAAYREAILEGAEAIFAERGFQGAKMADVAASAGLSLGTLYKVFPGKDEIHAAIHEWRGHDIIRHCVEELPEQMDPLEALLAGTRGYTRFQVEHPNYLRLTLRVAPSWTSVETMALGVDLEDWQRGFDLARQVFEGGQEAGMLVAGSASLYAKMMISILQVVLADWVEEGMRASADQVVRRVELAMVRAFATDAARAAWFARQQEL